LRPREALS